jgi:hypothetical protein
MSNYQCSIAKERKKTERERKEREEDKSVDFILF